MRIMRDRKMGNKTDGELPSFKKEERWYIITIIVFFVIAMFIFLNYLDLGHELTGQRDSIIYEWCKDMLLWEKNMTTPPTIDFGENKTHYWAVCEYGIGYGQGGIVSNTWTKWWEK